jgi:hypothetical protein
MMDWTGEQGSRNRGVKCQRREGSESGVKRGRERQERRQRRREGNEGREEDKGEEGEKGAWS